MQTKLGSMALSAMLAFVLGIGIAFVAVPLIAHTAAIAGPAGLSAWFKAHGMLPLGLFAWDTLVVSGLGIALPALGSFLLLSLFVPALRLWPAVCFGTGILISLYVLVPLSSGTPLVSPFVFPWWQHGLEASLLLAMGAAFGLSRFVSRNRPSERRADKAGGRRPG